MLSFFFLPVLLDLENKLEQRWQGSSLFSSREKEEGEKILFWQKSRWWYLDVVVVDVVVVVVVVDVEVLLLCYHFFFSLSFSIWRIS